MNILMINKFLYPKGGAENYMLRLGGYLQSRGHAVQYFGMEHPQQVVGNRVDAYTSRMDFHSGSILGKLTYPIKTIYSSEARRKLRLVLEDFQPDVCHLNNFNYQLTPSILLEIRKWQRESGHPCKILYTAHDYQLVCPNHMCYNPGTGENCEACLGGSVLSCVRGRCIHGSLAKSLVGAGEAAIWNRVGIYRELDGILCCSRFLKEKLDTNPLLAEKTVALHNFVDEDLWKETEKKDYVLYFGRYAQEKGVADLVQAAKALPQIPFVFAGAGPLEGLLEGIPNIGNAGFQRGEALQTLIREARFTVYPSRWQENCPLSVMESIACGTPVLGADIGGIPELIRAGENGVLVESGSPEALKREIESFWNAPERMARYTEACKALPFDTAAQYYEKIRRLYGEETPWERN